MGLAIWHSFVGIEHKWIKAVYHYIRLNSISNGSVVQTSVGGALDSFYGDHFKARLNRAARSLALSQ